MTYKSKCCNAPIIQDWDMQAEELYICCDACGKEIPTEELAEIERLEKKGAGK